MKELLFKDPRDYIKFEYEMRRSRRPAYSMRAFARDLSISPSSLNDFLKGRVGMSQVRIDSLADTLKWSPLRKEHFSDLISSKYDTDSGIKRASLVRVRHRLKEGSSGLSLDTFKTISDWYHLAILSMCTVRDHVDASIISKEYGISLSEAKEALKRLLRLNLLLQTEKGLKPCDDTTFVGDEKPSEALVNFHSQILDLSKRYLLEKSMQERNVQSYIFSIDADDIEEMNRELKIAAMKVINKYTAKSFANNVHIFSMQSYSIFKDSEKLK